MLSFSAVYNHIVISPVLLEIGADLGVSTGTAGLLVAGYGLPGVVVALFAGPFSDRRGRKPLLLWGTLAMSALTVAGALAPSFTLLLVTRIVGGVGASVVFPNVTAAVGDEFPYRERGRAMSTIIALNTMATIVGVPVAGVVADLTSWRASLGLVGALGVLSALVVWRLLPEARVERSTASNVELYGLILSDPSARGAIASSLLGAMFWFTWVTYMVAFFQTVYGLPASLAALIATTTGVGVLVGSQVGGRLGDRIGHKAIVGWTIAVAAVLLLLETTVVRDVWVAAALNFVISTITGARFATNTALLSEQAPSARGTMLAVNSAVVSFGIVAGTTVGGVLVDEVGFHALGQFGIVTGLASAAVVWRFVNERTADLAAGEAID